MLLLEFYESSAQQHFYWAGLHSSQGYIYCPFHDKAKGLVSLFCFLAVGVAPLKLLFELGL